MDVSSDGSQNAFAYQPALNALELKKDGTNYAISSKSKEVYISKLKSSYIAFLHSIKCSGYRIGIKEDSLTIEENNYATITLKVYIAYALDACPRNPTNSFKFKKCLFGATNLVKTSNKETWTFGGYGET